VKLHLGCGPNLLEGWHNYDTDVDIRAPLPWPDDSAELVFAEHVIEHVTMPEGVRFLAECYRVLKPGGALRLSFPDPERVWALHTIELERYASALQAIGAKTVTREDCVREVLCGWGHLSAWTERLALVVVQAAGFAAYSTGYGLSPITELAGIDSHHEWAGDAARLETSVVEGLK